MTEDIANPPGHGEPPEAARPVARPVGLARPVEFPAGAALAPGPMYLTTATRGSVWRDLGIFVVAIVLFDVCLGGALALVVTLAEGIDERVVQVIALPLRGAAWVALVILFLGQRGQAGASVGLIRGRLIVDIPLGLGALAAAFAAFHLGALALFLLWRDGWVGLTQNKDAIADMLPRLHPVLLVGLQFAVGFYEEVVFRGFLLTRLRRGLGSWTAAVMLSSALFAVAHTMEQEAAAAVPIFGLGVAFCMFTIWRKSLLPAVIGHALFNSCQILWLYYYNPDWT
jgi:membrane protease YdiL (CAAX protease family)